MPTRQDVHLSEIALFRYQIVAELETRMLSGKSLATAIAEVLVLPHRDHRGADRPLSERTLYRWFKLYQGHGLSGLEPKARTRVKDSVVLKPRMLEFLQEENKLDPYASVPELIRRARARGILSDDQPISRSTVWRACRRMGLALRRLDRLAKSKMRRFEYQHRMLMVLCDGKHFRAGVGRLRRVALCFLDDATRFGLEVIVGTSENSELFLHGLHRLIKRHGLMNALFLDNGPGFIASDTKAVVARLKRRLIHGSVRYPEGHGKVERFNRTLSEQLLRGLGGNPEVDPDPAALTLRLSHWLRNLYNQTPHEGLRGKSPQKRWLEDSRSLIFSSSNPWLDACFLSTLRRTVSKDNLISYKGTDYELPLGYSSRPVELTRHLLENDALSLLHHGRLVRLHPVDLHTNAYDRRKARDSPPPCAPTTPPRLAAHDAFKSELTPIVGPDGGYPKD